MAKEEILIINGWSIFAHDCFLDQLQDLLAKVEKLRAQDPDNYKKKNVTKRLAAIAKIAFENIPNDPMNAVYRQGDTLGDDHKHWFRAKFFQQYRLFFRFHQSSKTIVLGWVNDEKSKRAYDSNTDAYKVFKTMLDKGNPPDDWDVLLKEARLASDRLNEIKMNQLRGI